MKKIISTLIILASTTSLSGCSTLGQVFWSRPVIKDAPGGFNTLSLTADRRIAIMKSIRDPNDSKRLLGIKTCAEALPDVAISSTVKSEVKAEVEGLVINAIEAGKIGANFNEEVEQALTTAYQRTEKSDLVRQLGWQICQAHMNEAIDGKEYLALLKQMVSASLD